MVSVTECVMIISVAAGIVNAYNFYKKIMFDYCQDRIIFRIQIQDI